MDYVYKGMGSCCWQQRSVVLTACFRTVVFMGLKPREPMVITSMQDSGLIGGVKLWGSMFCAGLFGNDLWARFSNSPDTSVHKTLLPNWHYKRTDMHTKDAIPTKQNVTLWANWRYRGSCYKRIQLHRTNFHKVSGPIQIKLKSKFQGKLSIFRANCYFQGKFFPPLQ